MPNSGSFESNQTPAHAFGSGAYFAVDAAGGVDLTKLKPGTILEVETRNTTYTVIPQPSGEMMIWGHPEYCPKPILVNGLGTVDIAGVLREGYLGPGLHLSFPIDGKRVNTSRIAAIHRQNKH